MLAWISAAPMTKTITRRVRVAADIRRLAELARTADVAAKPPASKPLPPPTGAALPAGRGGVVESRQARCMLSAAAASSRGRDLGSDGSRPRPGAIGRCFGAGSYA